MEGFFKFFFNYQLVIFVSLHIYLCLVTCFDRHGSYLQSTVSVSSYMYMEGWSFLSLVGLEVVNPCPGPKLLSCHYIFLYIENFVWVFERLYKRVTHVDIFINRTKMFLFYKFGEFIWSCIILFIWTYNIILWWCSWNSTEMLGCFYIKVRNMGMNLAQTKTF